MLNSKFNPRNKTFIEKIRLNFFPLIFSCVFFLSFFYIIYSISQSYNWQFEKAFPFILTINEENGVKTFNVGILLHSVITTLELVFVGLILALCFGIILAGMKISSSPIAHLLASGFIGLIRNTPLLMQLYLIYFVFAPIFSFTPFFAAAFALACFESAYIAEILRAGFRSISQTQWEAGFSLGFNTLQVAKIVVLPQAVQNVLPSLIGQIVSLIKDTSLVSAIAVADITMRASEIISETYLSFEIWLIVALIYLILTSCVSIPTSLYARFKTKQSKHF